jgi:hypothetical protein
MDDTERSWLVSPGRRAALTRLAGLMAASPATALAQADPRPLSEHRRVPGLAEMRTAFDFEPVFFGNVTQAVYDYTAHGDGSEFTLRRNRQAFDWVDILASRAAIAASQVDLSSELFGVRMKYPILVAPTAAQVPLHPDGEKGMFQAATAAAKTPMILSVNTSTPVEQVAPAASGNTLWGQLYPLEALADMARLVDRYQTAGCSGIVITIDQQASFYERTQQDRNLGGRVRAAAAAVGGAAPATGSVRYRISDGRLWYSWGYIAEVGRWSKARWC